MKKRMPVKIQYLATKKIFTGPPFQDLFLIDPAMCAVIEKHIREKGIDNSQPIVVWEQGKDNFIVIDGHTRLKAAIAAEHTSIPAAVMEFADEAEALQYAIHNQRDRRNITDAELYRCIEIVDKRKPKGQRTDLASSEAKSGKSSVDTAEIAGTSPSKVEKTRNIIDNADEATKLEVLEGGKSINRADKETKEKRKGKNAKGKQEAPDKATQVLQSHTRAFWRLHTTLVKEGRRVAKEDIRRPKTTQERKVALREFLRAAKGVKEIIDDILSAQKAAKTKTADK